MKSTENHILQCQHTSEFACTSSSPPDITFTKKNNQIDGAEQYSLKSISTDQCIKVM